ncbi:MAG TPA: glycosyltransferase [Xanthobacteraceae bacterium]|nr:glycosyltransferase [Xanthobacteraceae bacterium]
MLSVVIPTENAERALVPTLAALVPGAMAGVVREVIVADAGSSDATAMIADAAGCRIDVLAAPLGQRLRQAAAGARSDWLLFLRAGAVPDRTWVDETRRFIEQAEMGGHSDRRAAAFRRTQDVETLGAAIIQGLGLIAAALGAAPRPQQGLLISKMLYERAGGHLDGDADPEGKLLRRLGRRRIVMLRSRALMAAAR